ncbi:DUF6355 family natural product biosynthesis protein [Streptomyces sp. WI04-05B]|uniref:DUF6355 family natural product biosynthesis protein n=1 Tax=Streptomyces TaxID=1883 RepID=UPI0029BECBDC|nr:MULTISPECIES: DUF6355 family natural product biosynthesis protein [unclassified Streptomyces]MDX2544958.1 DUF6355 family natural product biosynthesis protein [Streptomyces sp. WI04-05B]MDX2589006.1 DUF6355 family natural product biosynthesis protein [Streptomyces sp. WI04-05A]
MNVRRFLSSALAVVGPLTSALVLAVATPAATAAANPCGYYATSSDAYYNHCTSDGSHIVIEVEVWGPNYEKCVLPGVTWLGSSSRIDGAWYVGRTC